MQTQHKQNIKLSSFDKNKITISKVMPIVFAVFCVIGGAKLVVMYANSPWFCAVGFAHVN
jgi:hypothetical protein